MPDVTLQHCVATVVYGPEPPSELALDLTIGGSGADGVVDLIAEPSPHPEPLTLSTGSMGRYPLVGASVVKLHYRQSPGGPMDVTVTFRVV